MELGVFKTSGVFFWFENWLARHGKCCSSASQSTVFCTPPGIHWL